MIHGIGVDIAAISRFQEFINKQNTAIMKRLFTEQELEICNRRKDAASCMAARFAAKEAFLKALGTGLREGISWHDMEVVNDSLGKPELSISGNAKLFCSSRNINRTFLSLSHDGGNAIAMIVLES